MSDDECKRLVVPDNTMRAFKRTEVTECRRLHAMIYCRAHFLHASAVKYGPATENALCSDDDAQITEGYKFEFELNDGQKLTYQVEPEGDGLCLTPLHLPKSDWVFDCAWDAFEEIAHLNLQAMMRAIFGTEDAWHAENSSLVVEHDGGALVFVGSDDTSELDRADSESLARWLAERFAELQT